MKLLLTFYLLLFSFIGTGQIKTQTFTNGLPANAQIHRNINALVHSFSPPIGFQQKKQNGATSRTSSNNVTDIFEFAVPKDVSFDILQNSKEFIKNDTIFYITKIKAVDAVSVSIYFDSFYLSKNAEVIIYSDKEFTGPITAKENKENRHWGSRIYAANFLTIEVKAPVAERGVSRIKMGRILFGFVSINQIEFGNVGQSASCNINVVCPLGNGWENERSSVALINLGNGGLATGSLVMNTCGTNIPYFLTADHVVSSASNVGDWGFEFFFFSSTCSSNSNWREDMQIWGSSLKARYQPSDVALVQLSSAPSANSGIYYSGWDISSSAPSSATFLHHPAGDLMKISVDNDQLTTNSATITWNDQTVSPSNSHWVVVFDNGGGEGGSSGGPLYNPQHRIVGQNHGGIGTCPSSPGWVKYFGRFSSSWTGGGTNSTRLSNWLDPSNTGNTTTNTTSIDNLIPTPSTGLAISGLNYVCSSETFTLNVPSGTSVSWSIPFTGRLNLSSSANGNQFTISRNNTNTGTVTMTATVTTICGTYSVTKTVYIGPAPAQISGPYDPVQNTIMTPVAGGTYYFQAVGAAPATLSYTWTLIPPSERQMNTTLYSGSQPTISFDSSGIYTLQLATTSSTCSGVPVVSQQIQVIEWVGGMNIFTVTPNPVNSTFNIVCTGDISFEKSKLSTSQKNAVLKKVNIYDISGKLLISVNGGDNTSLQVNASNLISGIYVLEIYSSSGVERRRIMIQK